MREREGKRERERLRPRLSEALLRHRDVGLGLLVRSLGHVVLLLKVARHVVESQCVDIIAKARFDGGSSCVKSQVLKASARSTRVSPG